MRKQANRIALVQLLEKKYGALPAVRRETNIRDIMFLYDQYQCFVDREFVRDLLEGDNAQFQQRYWEMFLAHHLTGAGHKIARKKFGPDFRLDLNGKNIWIEAVAPNRTADIDAYYRNERLNGGGWFTPDIFQLRWTQAIDEKIKKYAAYNERGWVGADDACLIAVNSALLGSMGMVGKSDYPALVEVSFGVGSEYAVVDTASMRVVDQGYRREPAIMKKEIPVSKCFFLRSDTRNISAIVGSGVAPEANAWMIAVHNPFARNPLRLGTIGAEVEYYAEDCGSHFVIRTVPRVN